VIARYSLLDSVSSTSQSAALHSVAHSSSAPLAELPLFMAALDPAQASVVASGLGPLLSVGTLFFIIRWALAESLYRRLRWWTHSQPVCLVLPVARIVMTWYPNIKDDAFPWSIVYIPTEPLLAPTRKIITPVGYDCECRRCRTMATMV
jgi:YGGT family